MGEIGRRLVASNDSKEINSTSMLKAKNGSDLLTKPHMRHLKSCHVQCDSSVCLLSSSFDVRSRQGLYLNGDFYAPVRAYDP
jgi:hypothetical protein